MPIAVRVRLLSGFMPGVDVLARVDGKPVLMREGNVMAATFHPELTADSRVHAMLLESEPSVRAV